MIRCLVLCFSLALAAVAQDSSLFVSSTICSDCHSRLYPPGVSPNWSEMGIVHHGGMPGVIDPKSVAPFALWSASMMAHSAQDPYWRAKVRAETAGTPAAADLIENACLGCHAPMQQYPLRAKGQAARLDTLDQWGAEGVSCTVCHQISPEQLGARSSFTAGFHINEENRIFGPHEHPFPMPMRMHTGKTPTHAKHILDSALCGTCHTVITPTLTAEGEVRGEFLEQATYLEWLASDYARSGRACQSCHMPAVRDSTGDISPMYIAHTPHGGFFGPTRPRTPFGQHTFGGANVRMLNVLADLLPGKQEILRNAAERAQRTLAQALTVRLNGSVERDKLVVAVQLMNRAGHKLPSGFPSRRMWVRLLVEDASGRPVFESGAYDHETGELMSGGDVQPHRREIRSPREAAVYEFEMASTNGDRTVSLMRASSVLKDNRLLPLGFDDQRAQVSDLAHLSIAPVGVSSDSDFGSGGDTIRYQVALPAETDGPWTVSAEVLYQGLKPAYINGFRAGRSEEEAQFLKAIESHRSPIVVRREVLTIPNTTERESLVNESDRRPRSPPHSP